MCAWVCVREKVEKKRGMESVNSRKRVREREAIKKCYTKTDHNYGQLAPDIDL